MTAPRAAVAVAFGPRSVPVMDLTEAAAEECDLIWLIDAGVADMAQMSKLLKRFGPVVDIGGLSPTEAAQVVGPYEPAGVTTYFDTGMVQLAGLAQELGLPFHSPDTARAMVDKRAQRQALADHGIEVPGYLVLPSADYASTLRDLPSDIEWPVVLKPRSESGSRHTFLAHDVEEAVALLDSVGAGLEEMILEEYIPSDPHRSSQPYADYVSVETIVTGGRPSHLALTGRFPPAPTFRETGFCIPANVTEDDQAGAIALTERAIKALGVEVGCLHTEVKFTPSGPQLIEVNGRLGGGIPEMLARASGISALRLSLQVALGRAIHIEGPVKCDSVGYRFFVQPPKVVGTVRHLVGVDAVASYPGVDNITIHRGPGSRVDWRDGTRTFILVAVGAAPDHGAVLDFDRLLREKLVIEYDEDQDS